jgi:hypothetical protein
MKQSMTYEEIEVLVRNCLLSFYQRRISKLSGLQLQTALRKKNPYLFRAIGIQTANDIVAQILQAFMSSSDETIFGNEFFEPLAKKISGGTVSGSEGVDIVIETDTKYTAISVKSSPNAFNSSQAKRMNDEFNKLRSRMLKIQKQFDPMLGHCYGKVNSEPKQYTYRRRSGQVFWEEISGDPDCYLKIMQLMGDLPNEHLTRYREEYEKALNRFTRDFLNDFATTDGEIDWDKLLIFNSGSLPIRKFD